MSRRPDPGLTAAYDQALAHADEMLGRWIREYQRRVQRDGGQQASADLALTLAIMPPGPLAGLLVAAIRRLAGEAS